MFDPDTSDVPWQDKRRTLAELAFDTAFAQSGNYIADSEVNPSKVKYANGRVVTKGEHGLIVEMQNDGTQARPVLEQQKQSEATPGVA